MCDRLIEERAEFPNGIKCEWEPSPHGKVDEREARATVVALNKKAKEQGSYLRYRSVSVED